MEKRYDVFSEAEKVFTGQGVDLREWLEEQLMQSSLGISPMLQEDEDEELVIYLHSEWTEDLEEEDIDKITALGLSEIDCLDVIQGFLGITIAPSREERV